MQAHYIMGWLGVVALVCIVVGICWDYNNVRRRLK